MKKYYVVVLLLAAIVALFVFVEPKMAKANLLNTVEKTYEQAVLGEKPISYEQTQAIGRKYTKQAIKGLTDEELDDLDGKIHFIANSYLEYEYKVNAPTQSAQDRVDDNGWKLMIPSPFVPPVRDVDGTRIINDSPGRAWEGPQD